MALIKETLIKETLYVALRAAGVPEDKARAAAIEAAAFDRAIADIRSTLRLHTWILSINTAAILAILGRLLARHLMSLTI
jgi:hypothetical protein